MVFEPKSLIKKDGSFIIEKEVGRMVNLFSLIGRTVSRFLF